MKISVFITSYNQKKFLIEAIESVLNQTLSPFQIIVVDDSSKDLSQEVIAGYAARYPNLITPIFHKGNTGVAQVRIDALNAVNGDYVTYVDGDDRFLPTKLEKEAKSLRENPKADIVFSNNYYMTEDGKRFRTWIDDEMPPVGEVFCQTFGRSFPKRSLFRMELVNYQAWRSIGYHDRQLKLYEDFDMRIRLTKKLKTVYYHEPLSEIRDHNKGLSKSKATDHLNALEYIYHKNRYLLSDQSLADRNQVVDNLTLLITSIAKNAALDLANSRNSCLSDKIQALKYYFWYLKYRPAIFDMQLLLKILLPLRAYNSIQSMNKKIFNK